jgi:imidazolonepropionase
VTDRAATFVHDIGVLATVAPDVPLPLRGSDLHDAVEHIENAAIAIDEAGNVLAFGREDDVRDMVEIDDATAMEDACSGLVTPGLVDCHSHAVFAGDRANEFDLRNRGASYEALHASGGGIRSTVAATRAALADQTIANDVRRHFDWMIARGTTTAEVKSGYALTIDGEIESLRVAAAASTHHPLRTVGTLLAAHTVPEEYEGDSDSYIDAVAIPALAQVASNEYVTAADVFLERGSFGLEQARRYLAAAIEHGLAARLHGDQFSDQGGIDLAIDLGARSIDHLEALEPDASRLRALADSDVAAVLLPLSSLFLRRPYAPGRALVDAGAIVAVASDFNPGSSYGESLTLAMSLAGVGCGLSAREAFAAVTANAAWVLDCGARAGRFTVGQPADFVVFDQPALEHLAYHVGSPGVQAVYVAGQLATGRYNPGYVPA